LSTKDLAIAEMDPLNPLTKSETLGLLPEPGTLGIVHIDTRGTIWFRSREPSETTADAGHVGARFAVSLYSSLMSQITTSTVALASMYVSAVKPVLAEFVQEWQKYQIERSEVVTRGFVLFKNTMKTANPFLPRQGVVIYPEVREHMKSDEQLRKIIDASVIELSNALEDEESYYLDIFEETDVDVPAWNENVIRVRTGTMNFENKMKLWERLEERVRSKIEEIRKQLPPNKRRKIDAMNESLSIRLEEEAF
jgi:hypothetical protein